ncbi:MAG: SPOR domain-containing protein [Bacteroidales bacterium]|nr:SPOR domain-containing protein [Bacteroidales bacterium]
MQDIFSRHIATLLRHHDCVVLPGIGAFIATRESAVVSDDLLTPPTRRISFNAALTHDDGLLASSVSRRMKISFEQARIRVEADSSLLLRRLSAEGAVKIARVGTLQNASGHIEFVPDAVWTLSFPALRAIKPSPAFEVISPNAEEPEKAVAIVRVPLRLRWLRAAAAAIIVATLGFALSTPIDLEQAQYASLAAPQFTPPQEPAFEQIEEPESLTLNLGVAPRIEESAEEIKSVEVDKPLPYVIVIASLPSQAKAQEFIDEQGIPSLQILQSGEKFRVYAGQGASADEARANAELIDGFSSRYHDAWVCRR